MDYKITSNYNGNVNAAFQLEDSKDTSNDPEEEDKEEGKVDKEKQEENVDKEKQEENVAKEAPIRDNWDRPIEFLLSCISMSVGLGNIWRFPFTAYENGGGAFLIPYLIVLLLVGRPLYYMELCVGQFASYGPVKIWNMVPAFRGVGYGQAIANSCVASYYMSLMGLTVFYFISSFKSILPWSTCPVGASSCIDASTNLSAVDVNVSVSTSAAEYYFIKKVLKRYPNGFDDGIYAPDLMLSLCLLFSWVLLFCILVKGVKSSGKSAYFTALFPYVILFVLLGRGASLPGAVNGIKYFVTPQWEKLLEPKVWYAAVGQCFFSLNVGFGAIVMFASYNKFSHNIYRDAVIISCTDTVTSFLAGCTIFAILGHLANLMGVDDINLVIKGGGSALAFISYPDVIARFHWLSQLFAVLFFLMLFTLGIGSASAMVGSIITVICDALPYLKRYIVTLVVCLIGFGLGLFYVTPQGTYILDLVDHYGGTFIVYIFAFLEVIAINWIYGYSNFTRDIEFMLKRKTGYYWGFCWVFFIPVLLFVIFTYTLAQENTLQSGSYVFGPGANGFGYFITAVAVAITPVCLVIAWHKNTKRSKTFVEAFKMCFRPTAEWSPRDPVLRKQYKEFCLQRAASKLKGIDNLGAFEEKNDPESDIVSNGFTKL